MADFDVAMSPDELPDEVLRDAIARALRRSAGRVVDTTSLALSLVVNDIDWWEIAVSAQTLIEAIRHEDEVDGLLAFDFGTGERFVVEVDVLDRQTLVAVVPADEHDETLRQLVRGWIWRSGWGNGHFPILIRSIFAGEVWLARELTMALRGDEEALSDHLAAIDVAAEADPDEALEHWDHAVMVEGCAPTIELFQWEARGEQGAFAAWLGEVAVSWDDTGAAVAPEDALRLWLVCQYLALANDPAR